ncbi:MAG: RluA family pseudouridine synthase [Nitrosomonas sp.]
MNSQQKKSSIHTVQKIQIADEEYDQRIDNFLFKRFKSVPKSHIYQLLRSGQIRVDGKRIRADYRLQFGNILRIPPIRLSEKDCTQAILIPAKFFTFHVLFEDEALLVIDKPGGIAVHGGSGINFGVIEQLRAQNPSWKFLELVHRLDRETSGLLMLAKKRNALVELHRQIRDGLTRKHYLTMVCGNWLSPVQHVKLALNKYITANGERRVAVVKEAIKNETIKPMPAYTIFRLQKTWNNFSLLDAELKTGRTHQIRVHLAYHGFPIAGDDKYGNFEINKQLARSDRTLHLSRMFLHAHTLQFTHPISKQSMELHAPLANDLQSFINQLDTKFSVF